MHSAKTVFVLLLLLLVLSCNKKTAREKLSSGVEGQVLLGPMTAVVTQNSKPDRPYQATINVLDSTRNEITQIETDKEGRFKVPLEPGVYILSPIAPNPPLPPTPEEKKVQVKEGEFTQVLIRFDTGIR
jgi:hypothetical protein